MNYTEYVLTVKNGELDVKNNLEIALKDGEKKFLNAMKLANKIPFKLIRESNIFPKIVCRHEWIGEWECKVIIESTIMADVKEFDKLMKGMSINGDVGIHRVNADDSRTEVIP